MRRFRALCFCLPLLFAAMPRAVAQNPAPASPAQASGWMWVWASAHNTAVETVYVRHRFRLPAAPVSALLRITADDMYTVFCNGGKRPVAEGNDWTTVREFDVTRFLKAGSNLLAVESRNTGGPGGVLYKLTVTLRGGKTVTVVSGPQARINRRVPPNWIAPEADDSRWPAAVALAKPNEGTWGPLRAASAPDYSRLVRLWDVRAGGEAGADPYTRTRNTGDRMLLSASISSRSDMQILAGAGFTLFQSDSDHLATEETAAGKWNWREPASARSLTRNLGLDWCYFPHFAFPPEWYRNSVSFTRLQCLEHGQPVQAFSPWDPAWPTFVDRGYEALSSVFGKGKGEKEREQKTVGPRTAADNSQPPASKRQSASALYIGIHGDYGEAGFPMGARVSVPGQREDWERRFGQLHDHLGWWCADPLARQDFRSTMLAKYGGLEGVNAAWRREFKAPEEIIYPEKPRGDAKQEWLDFVAWYQGGIAKAVEANLNAARKHFPDTLRMLPAGMSDEDPRGGNDNSLLAKLAAQYGADIRSTHSAYKPFAENAATMFGRLGSAARFYGVPFWAEPPSGLTAEQEVGRIFEAVSQGAKGLFDWSSSAVPNRDVYYRYGRLLRTEKPIVDVAMFYPAEAQRLRPDQGVNPLFAAACAYLRDAVNFDVVDDRMVRDGALSRFRVLALWEGTQASPETLAKIKEWVEDGGVVVAYDFGKVTDFSGNPDWFADMFGYANELKPARVTEKYEGALPTQYRIRVGEPDAADYLGDGWFTPEMEGGELRRWTSREATILLPVRPSKKYAIILRASVPGEVEGLKRSVLLNGRRIGSLNATGDVTYRFVVPEDLLTGNPLSRLTLQSETFLLEGDRKGVAGNGRRVGVLVSSIQVVEIGAKEDPAAPPPPGRRTRELDLRLLGSDWARIKGKGLTVFFPATRALLKGYVEVIRRAAYHLSAIQEDHRDALALDDEMDGVYATLFTDKALFYNPTDKPVTKTVTFNPATVARWRGEVVAPAQTSYRLTLDPHSITPLYFALAPQEMLFECERFTDLGGTKAVTDTQASPGAGLSAVRLGSRTPAITTKVSVDTAGQYALFTRCLRNGVPEPVDVLVDGQLLPPLNARAGQTFLAGSMNLSRGTHTFTLRARPGRDVRADFLLLTNDATIAGYDFAARLTPVE